MNLLIDLVYPEKRKGAHSLICSISHIAGLESVLKRSKITRQAAPIPSRQHIYKFSYLLKYRTVNNSYNEISPKCSRVMSGHYPHTLHMHHGARLHKAVHVLVHLFVLNIQHLKETRLQT